MKKVLVYGYRDLNFGDDMMIEQLINHVHAMGCKPYIFVNDSFVEFTRTSRFEIGEINELSAKALKNEGIGYFVYIGGSMFPHDTIKEGLFRYKTLRLYKSFKRAGIKLCLVNCNISWNVCRVGVRATNKILTIVDFITCRDEASYEYIKKYNSNVLCFPDVLFSVFRMNANEKKKGVISISTYFAYKSSTQKMNKMIYKVLLALVNKLETDLPETGIQLLSFDGGYHSDLPMAYKIKENCKNKDKVDVISYEGNINSFLEALGNSEYILGVRFHSVVYALATETPFFALVYDRKTEELLNDLGLQNFGERISAYEQNALCLPPTGGCLNEKKREEVVQKSKLHIEYLEKYIRQN